MQAVWGVLIVINMHVVHLIWAEDLWHCSTVFLDVCQNDYFVCLYCSCIATDHSYCFHAVCLCSESFHPPCSPLESGVLSKATKRD